MTIFLSTPSARRATAWLCAAASFFVISIHAAVPAAKVFLSTPSARRATKNDGFHGFLLDISIHALREEGDTSHGAGGGRGRYFYPRPPRGGRLASYTGVDISKAFLSTPSARRATGRWQSVISPFTYFYPRPPRGGRPVPSLHLNSFPVFLSTPSARRATHSAQSSFKCPPISIHALREEGDCLCSGSGSGFRHFYPRPPRGGRRVAAMLAKDDKKISIHALREEGDQALFHLLVFS